MLAHRWALYAVKLACEQPERHGRSLAQWDCREVARQLIADGVVQTISAETVRRIFQQHHLKPWRHHLWLSAKVPRDTIFAAQIQEISTLYTRPLAAWEVVLSIDEKTNLQPRPRKAATLSAQAGKPIRLEHEYERKGTVNLFAAFDTRSGHVYAATASRKRQVEFITFLKQLDREIAAKVRTIHLVLDNSSIHKGKQVQAWLTGHPRFLVHFLPTHCSWMNQIEQFFSILQRKRLRFSDFTDTTALTHRLLAFVAEWNSSAHPFNWSTQSVAKVMAKCHHPSSLAA
jgi:transposase